MNAEPKARGRLSIGNQLHIYTCLAFLAVFLQFAIRPAYVSYDTQRKRVLHEESRLAEHRTLHTFAAELTALLNSPRAEALSGHDRVPLHKEEFADIHPRLQQMCEIHGLHLQEAAPQMLTLRSGRHFLGVRVVTEGAFTDMRPFLLAVMQLPSYYHMERLAISEGPQQEHLEAQIWLLVK